MKGEILRKFFHMLVVLVFIPIAALSKGVLILIIVTGLIFYLFYESHASAWGKIPVLTELIGKLKRLGEQEITYAPFRMGAGIAITVLVFPFRPATAGLLQLAFCDMAAALVGMNWGKRKLP